MVEDPQARPLFVLAGTPRSRAPARDGRPARILASTGRRIVARSIDLVVTPLTMGIPALLLMTVLFKVADTGSGLTGIAIGIAVAGGLVSTVGGWFLARVVRFARYGCTVGQRIAGIRVVRLEDGVRNPGCGQAFRRWMVPWGGGIGPGPLTPLGDIWAYRRDTRTRQCLHDERSETVVVLAPGPDLLHLVMLGSSVVLVALALITFAMVKAC